MKVAFIGLGVMGFPMAGHLQQSGYQVTVYNRTQTKAQAWQAQYVGEIASSPKLAAYNADVVFICVGNDDDVKSVVLGENGVLSGMKQGAILVDHTTASADLAKELNELCLAQNSYFIDAPVSGGQSGAENGVLTVMCGGRQEIFDKVEPVFKSYARFSQLMGDVGAGQLSKMVNQICIAGLLQGLAEGFNFAEKVGLSPEKLVDTISKGAAGSWQMENRYQAMFAGEFDFGFAVDWMRKDLSIAFAEAEKCQAELPVAKLVDGFYQQVQALGGGRWDTSSLIARYQKGDR